MNPNEAPKTCAGTCKCHMMKPLAVIIFALAWICATTGCISWYALNITWPILLILVMFPKLCCKCCKK